MMGGRILAPLLICSLITTACFGSDDDPLPDFAAADFTASLIADLGAEPDEVAAGVLGGLLGEDASPEVQAELIESLATVFASPDGNAQSSGDATSVVLDGLVRRLGTDAATASNADELIAQLVEAIDPTGEIDSPEELLAAITKWVAENPANVLRIVSFAEAAAGPLMAIESASFEEIAAILEEYALSAEVLDIPLAGVEGLEALTVPGVRWDIDQPTRSITFTGDTTLFEERVPLLLSAYWGASETPGLVVAARAAGWSLEGFGVEGPMGEHLFADITFVLSGSEPTLTRGTLSPLAVGFLAETYAAELEDVRIVQGVNLFAALPLSTLPRPALDQLGLNSDNSLIGLSGSLGTSFAAMSGEEVDDPTSLLLAATLPPIEPPSFPEWLSTPDDARWSLTLAYAEEALTFGLAGQLEALIDGERRAFAVTFDLAADSNSASGVLVGESLEPWEAPFGVKWLTFERLRLELSLDSDDAAAVFSSDLSIAGRDATLTFELKNGESGGSAELTASIKEMTTAEMVSFVAERFGATAPPVIPSFDLSGISLSVLTGPDFSIAFSAGTEVAGKPTDLLISAISVNGGKPSVVIGLGLPDWKLADALPSLDGSLLEEIAFPPTALAFGSIDATIPSGDLPTPMRDFFASARFGGGSSGSGGSGSSGGSSGSGASGLPDFDLDLKSGLSMLGSISFAGTELESPMEALGFSGASFPVVGTLPSSMIGLGGGGGSGGGSPLADLELSVELPKMSPPGTPEWFRSGQLSFEITGQPSLGLRGELTVIVDGEELTFVVGAEFARSGAGVSVSLFGALETERPWEEPFGIEWLTLNRVAVELSVTATGNVGVGFAGSMIIGTKDIDVAVKLEINAATGVPTNFILAGASEEGVATSDLIALQNQIATATNPNAQPIKQASSSADLALRNIEFLFAPKASPPLGVEAGFILAGDAYIAFDSSQAPTRFAYLDFRLTADGLFALGHLQAYDLGPLAWSDIDLDVELSLQDQHFFFDGGVELLGAEAQVHINLSTGSIFFAGQQALEDLKLIVQAFEVFVNDPFGSVEQLPLLFRELGVPQPPWVKDLVAAIQVLADKGQQTSDAAIEVMLNGGTIPLIAFPVGGEPRVCSILTPIQIDGRCYTIPPAASPGVPLGGSALVCDVLRPFESGGRCYTIAPSSTTACPVWAPFVEGGKCYSIRPGFLDSDGTPNGGTSKVTITIPGVPDGGVAKSRCRAIYPFEVDGRCYTIPPGQILLGTPEGGNPLICRILVGTFEGGRCWTVSPSQAAAGIQTPGICTTFAGVSCSWEQLTQQDLRPLLLDPLVGRLNRWE